MTRRVRAQFQLPRTGRLALTLSGFPPRLRHGASFFAFNWIPILVLKAHGNASLATSHRSISVLPASGTSSRASKIIVGDKRN